MVIIRPVRWPDDAPALAALDTSFTTDRIYAVERQSFAVTLVERSVSPALTKTICPLDEELDSIQKLRHVVVAEVDRQIVGLAAAHYSAWNGRVVLWHLYVGPAYRGSGVGTALMQSVLDYARTAGAWCVWLEAQNVNYPAIQFYLRCGFRMCGLDTNLYHPEGMGKGEVAVFMAREVSP